MKLIDALCNCVSQQDLEEKKQSIRELAMKLEASVYQSAKSSDEYYHLLAEKIYKLKKAQQEVCI